MTEYIELLEFTIQHYRQRIDELICWINDVERKAATLIAANGVVIALSASLISIMILLYQNMSLLTISYGPISLVLIWIIYLLYFIQIVLFAISIYHAYLGHRVETLILPNITYLYEECQKEIRKSRKEILMQEVSEYVDSKDNIANILDNKSKNVMWAQYAFVSGCITLSALLLMLLFVVVIGGFG